MQKEKPKKLKAYIDINGRPALSADWVYLAKDIERKYKPCQKKKRKSSKV